MRDNQPDIERIPDSDHEALAQAVQTACQSDDQMRSLVALDWEQNLRFLDGDMYLTVTQNGTSGSVQSLPRPRLQDGYYPRPVTNRLLSRVRTLTSSYLTPLPMGSVRARTNSTEHREKARIADRVREALWELGNEDIVYAHLVMYFIACGIAWKKDYFDTSIEAKLWLPNVNEGKVEIEGEPLLDSQGMPIEDESGEDETYFAIRSKCVSPFEMMTDTQAETVWDVRWLAERSVESIDYVRSAYDPAHVPDETEKFYTGKHEKVQPGPRSLEGPLATLHRLRTSGYRYGQIGTSEGVDMTRSVVLTRYWQIPTEKHPNGRHIITAGDVTLYAGPSPFMPRFWHPYTPFVQFPLPGRTIPVSIMTQARPIQQRVNSINIFQMLYRKSCLGPKMLLPKGSGIPRDHITGRPGQIIEIATGAAFQPQFLYPPIGVLGETQKELEQCVMELDELFGARKIQSGETPRGVPSYSGLAFLNEQAEDEHALSRLLFRKSFEMSETKKLQLVAMGLTANIPRFTEMVREKLAATSEAELSTFVGSDLQDNVDVRVEKGETAPQSKVLLQEVVFKLIELGLLQGALQDPRMRELVFDLFGVSEYANVDSADVIKAEAENALLLRGDPRRTISPVDNHDIHIRVHYESMKTMRAQELPEEIRSLVLQHIGEHMQMQQGLMMQQPGQALGQQVQADAQLGGTVPGPQGVQTPLALAGGPRAA